MYISFSARGIFNILFCGVLKIFRFWLVGGKVFPLGVLAGIGVLVILRSGCRGMAGFIFFINI